MSGNNILQEVTEIDQRAQALLQRVNTKTDNGGIPNNEILIEVQNIDTKIQEATLIKTNKLSEQAAAVQALASKQLALNNAQIAKDTITSELASKRQLLLAAQEQAARDQAAQEQAAREQAAREQAAQEQAAQAAQAAQTAAQTALTEVTPATEAVTAALTYVQKLNALAQQSRSEVQSFRSGTQITHETKVERMRISALLREIQEFYAFITATQTKVTLAAEKVTLATQAAETAITTAQAIAQPELKQIKLTAAQSIKTTALALAATITEAQTKITQITQLQLEATQAVTQSIQLVQTRVDALIAAQATQTQEQVARDQAAQKQASQDQGARDQAERDKLAQIEKDRLAQVERDRLAQVERDRLAQVEKDKLLTVAQALAKFNKENDEYIKKLKSAENVKEMIKTESVKSYNKAQAEGLSYDQSSKIGNIIARKLNTDIGPDFGEGRNFVYVNPKMINPILSRARTETDKLIKQALALQENFSNTEDNTSGNIIWYIILILIIMLIIYVMTKK